ncbi:OmpA family protein [Alkalibacterium sp. f15]|uniref:OmpA family protein n=1 Tax=Alkalibacterium sp. f15 TaxID=3414029 RepID=UPI003BF8C32F
MARQRKKAKQTGAPAWMTTYSDLMSLLLTFFILLFSMSVVSEERFKEVAESLRMALIGSSSDAILDNSGNALEDYEFEDLSEFDDVEPEDLGVEDSVMMEDSIPEEVHELYQTVTNYLEIEGLETDITLSRDQEGVYIDIQEAILFDSGSATLKMIGRETIGSLAGLFELFDNEIIVEGYTDNIPMSSRRFPSNWELSIERAVSVLRYLSESHGVEPDRLSARGYGEHRPVVPNDSPENRSQNRRVNIIIVHEHRKEDTNGSER